MEHQKVTGKPMSKILNFLPRVTSSLTFKNPPLYSPSKDKKPSEKTRKSNLGIGFSGAIIPTLPPERRRKIKNDSKYTPLHEPTSPKVSCMGQVTCKHYRRLTGNLITKKPSNKISRTTSYAPVRTYNKEDDQEKVDLVVVKSKKKLGFWRLFSGSQRKSDSTELKMALNDQKGLCLGAMKRFSSGRDVFMNFDWRTQVAPLDFEDEGREEVAVPSSAPVRVRNEGAGDGFVKVGGVKLEPRKEINLWKRRTMAQPQPLQVHALN